MSAFSHSSFLSYEWCSTGESSLKSQKKPLLEYENTESTTSSDMSVLKITLCCKIKLVRHTWVYLRSMKEQLLSNSRPSQSS